jgi:hypothetical protein
MPTSKNSRRSKILMQLRTRAMQFIVQLGVAVCECFSHYPCPHTPSKIARFNHPLLRSWPALHSLSATTNPVTVPRWHVSEETFTTKLGFQLAVQQFRPPCQRLSVSLKNRKLDGIVLQKELRTRLLLGINTQLISFTPHSL